MYKAHHNTWLAINLSGFGRQGRLLTLVWEYFKTLTSVGSEKSGKSGDTGGTKEKITQMTRKSGVSTRKITE
jgi:hypothetical protein